MPVRDDLDDHAEPGVPAVHRGLEVVVVLDRPFAVDLLFEDRLHLLEGLAVDERGVAAGELDAHGTANLTLRDVHGGLFNGFAWSWDA
ncbi:MAG: hypothetical protein ACOYBP_06875 [Microbacteriaceae bacterium]